MAKRKSGGAALDQETGAIEALEKALEIHGKPKLTRELEVSEGLVDRWRSGDAIPTDEELAKLELLAKAARGGTREGSDKELELVKRVRALAELTQTPAWRGSLVPYIRAQVACAEREILDDASGGELQRLRGRRDALNGLLGYFNKQAEELRDLPLFTGKVSATWNPEDGVLTVSELSK